MTAGRWLGGRSVRHVAQLMLGTGSAQALTLLAAPLLSRLYDPAAFGLYGVFLSLTTMVTSVATLRYEYAIVVENDDGEALNGVVVSVAIAIGLSAVLGLGVLAGRDAVATALGVPELAPHLWWLPGSLLFVGAYQALNYWSTRRERFRRIAASQMVRSVGAVGIQVGSGLAGMGGGGLIGGNALGPAIAAVALGAQSWRDEGRAFMQRISWRSMRGFARRHIAFPTFGAPQALLNAASQGLPAMLLASAFGASTVGLYVMAVRVLQMPINLVGQAARQVLLSRAARTRDAGGDLWRLYLTSLGALAGTAVLPAVILFTFSPSLFAWALGSEWTTAGEYARWLLVWLVPAFVNAPATAYVNLLGYQRMLLGYDVVLLIARATAILVGAHLADAALAIALYSVVGAAFNLWLIATMGAAARRYARRPKET